MLKQTLVAAAAAHHRGVAQNQRGERGTAYSRAEELVERAIVALNRAPSVKDGIVHPSGDWYRVVQLGGQTFYLSRGNQKRTIETLVELGALRYHAEIIAGRTCVL